MCKENGKLTVTLEEKTKTLQKLAAQNNGKKVIVSLKKIDSRHKAIAFYVSFFCASGSWKWDLFYTTVCLGHMYYGVQVSIYLSVVHTSHNNSLDDINTIAEFNFSKLFLNPLLSSYDHYLQHGIIC